MTGQSGGRVVLAFFLSLAATPALAQEAERWTFGGTLRETLIDNLFLTSTDTSTEAITGGSFNLAYSRIDPHSSLTASGWLGASKYDRLDAYSGAQYGVGVGGRVNPDPRLQLRFGASYADGLNLESFFASRIGTPQFDLKSGTASLGLTYLLTPGTSVNAQFDGSWIRYRTDLIFDTAKLPADSLVPADVLAPVGVAPSSPDAVVAPDSSQQALGLLSAEELRLLTLDYWTWRASSGLQHDFSPETRVTVNFGYRRANVTPQTYPQGEQLDAEASFRRVLDNTANLSLAYGYQDSLFQSHFQTHALTLQAVKQFSQKVKGDGSIGVSYLDGPRPTSGYTVIGGAGLSAQFKRTFLVARYTRTRYQGLVIGDNQVTDVIYASLGHQLTKHLSGAVYGNYSDGRDDLNPLYSYSRTIVGASLTTRIKKRGSAGASYTHLDFENQGRPAAQSSVVSFFVGYSHTGR